MTSNTNPAATTAPGGEKSKLLHVTNARVLREWLGGEAPNWSFWSGMNRHLNVCSQTEDGGVASVLAAERPTCPTCQVILDEAMQSAEFQSPLNVRIGQKESLPIGGTFGVFPNTNAGKPRHYEEVAS